METIAASEPFVFGPREGREGKKTFVFGEKKEGEAQLKSKSVYVKSTKRTKDSKKKPQPSIPMKRANAFKPVPRDQTEAKNILKNIKIKDGIIQGIQLPKEAKDAAPVLTKILRDTFTPEPQPVTGDRSKSKKSSSVIEGKIEEKLRYENIELAPPKKNDSNYKPPAEEPGPKSPENPDPENPDESREFGVTLPGVETEYLFYAVCKFVLFDRRYINYNVYRRGPDGRWFFLYSLIAYTSSSQVGSWRLCLTEAGNRLAKFDDYTQSTALHPSICILMSQSFYNSRLPWAYENEVSTDPQVTAATQARNRARNSIQAGVIVATDYSNVMEGGPQQYLSYPPVYLKSNPDPALTRIIVGRGIPDMFNFWSEIDGQGVIRHKKGTCGSKELYEDQIIQHLKDFTQDLTGAYQPIIHIFLYDDKMTYVTQDKKLFKSTAQVFLIISRKIDDNPVLPTFIMQVCVAYTIEQWIIPFTMNIFQVPDFLNQFLEGNITDNQMLQQGFALQMRIYGSYVMGMPVPDWRVNQLGLPPLNIIGDYFTCKPMEYTTQCRIVEYLRLQNNPSIKIPTVLIENYHYVGYRNSANFPFNIIYRLTPGEIEIIYKYREDNAVIREKSINTDDDLNFLDREIQASTGAAAAIQADMQAAKTPRFLTIEYPFFVEEMGRHVAIVQGDVNQNRTLTEIGKQKLLSLGTIPRENDKISVIADITRQNSFNRTLKLLNEVNKKILGGIQEGIRSFTIYLNDSDGGPVEISGGRKTRKNKMKKTNKNKNKKQYKNKRHTNKRKKCKQLMRKTMNRKM